MAAGPSPRASRRQGNSIVRRPEAWTGVRSDPFFFDLTGFIGTTTQLTTGTRSAPTRWRWHATDFFKNLNTNAIVLSIPKLQLPTKIGVWATTSYSDAAGWHAADQMGRPAINTVFNPAADKDLFNVTPPPSSRRRGGKFRTTS